MHDRSSDPFDPDSHRSSGPQQRSSRTRLIAIFGALAVLLLAAIFAFRMTRDGPAEDRLQDNAVSSASSGASDTAEERCGSQRTYDLVKRELFRRAAQLRGSDSAAFDQLSAYATVRVTAPVVKRRDEQIGSAVCSGSLALDLPPGVAVVGGRRTLQANVDYALQPAADGSGDVVTLGGADAIIVPLATLARTGTQPAQAPSTGGTDRLGQPMGNMPPVAPPVPGAPPPPEAFPPAERAPDRVPPPPRMEVPQAGARPSFKCARARTRGEIAVCNSPELSALDRQMASFFNTAYRGADPEARALLQRTRNRFLAFRDRCDSDRCIADTYRGRITEIRDIVDGRWRPQ